MKYIKKLISSVQYILFAKSNDAYFGGSMHIYHLHNVIKFILILLVLKIILDILF